MKKYSVEERFLKLLIIIEKSIGQFSKPPYYIILRCFSVTKDSI